MFKLIIFPFKVLFKVVMLAVWGCIGPIVAAAILLLVIGLGVYFFVLN
ncbi:MAG: hypothetical protein O2909_11955 [Chloroflexi bacterium]|nr:hypothetical protein [Chloroflexota bacterium]MDA1220133.1 hypothetical protein [Chloroflexota bacterium]